MKIKFYKIAVIYGFILCSTINLYAQKRDVRLNFGLHKNIPETIFDSEMSRYNDKNGGIGIHIYPNWHYNERVTLGVNIEPTLVARDDIIDDTQFLGVLSLSPTANYHFTNSKIKPFAGLGVGLYSVVIRHYSSFNVGVRPIIGISFSNFFDFSIEYNKILSSTSLGSFDNYYLAIKGSFSIGIFTSKRKRNMQQTSKVLENQYKRQI